MAEPNLSSIAVSKRLGELLVEAGLITPAQLQEAVELQRKHGGKLGSLLLQKGLVDEKTFLEFLAKQCGIRHVVLSTLGRIPEEVISCIPEAVARRHILIPIHKNDKVLAVAMADPLNVLVLDDLKMMTGLEVQAVLSSESEILAAIAQYYSGQSPQEALDQILKRTGAVPGAPMNVVEEKEADGGDSIITLGSRGEDAPIIQLVNLIMASAIKNKASDIHVEPYPKDLRVRFRIDGVLHEQPAPPKRFQNAIVSRVKIMANLDIAERRIPQDGRIRLKVGGQEIDLRVSILPCAAGEKVVMRILDSSGLKVRLEDLGFEPEHLAIYRKYIRAPHGIILVTGPTGSGKSTTLYSTLAQLNQPDVNISTIEDPVEYTLHGINQVQVNADVGLTFATGLRSFLRQDPDIIFVGEIRDVETIQIAINAALTGHLVFSTLHTNDAPGAMTRMTVMGVEPFLISSSVLMVVAQRLVRTVCKQCRESYEVDERLLAKLGLPDQKLSQLSKGGKIMLARGKGCDNCAGTGYRGRVGIHEVLEMSDPLRELIGARASANRIKEVARKTGMMTLRESAVQKVLKGITTVEEMIRVTASDVD